MEMVAVSKMKKSVSDVTSITDYIKEIKSIINNIKTESEEKHRFFDNSVKSGAKQDELVIIFASNKGLCGSFNSNIYKKTKRLVEDSRKTPGGLTQIKYAICFGKFAEKIARKLNLEIKLSVYKIEDIMKPTNIHKIENFARNMYSTKEVNKIWAVYTNFIKMGVYEPRAVTLYPIDKNLNSYTETFGNESILEDKFLPNSHSEKIGDSPESPRQKYIFEPSVETLIEKTIPKIIKMILYSFVIESRASENSSRSFAMKRANESASEMLTGLKIKFNKVRQDSITQEIAEISAGANAG